MGIAPILAIVHLAKISIKPIMKIQLKMKSFSQIFNEFFSWT
jgi:hypothetical protein